MKDALCMYVRRFAGCTVQCTGSSGYTQPAREPVLDEVKPILATRGGIRVALGKLALTQPLSQVTSVNSHRILFDQIYDSHIMTHGMLFPSSRARTCYHTRRSSTCQLRSRRCHISRGALRIVFSFLFAPIASFGERRGLRKL